MGGNARMDSYARGVLQDLFARALWVENGETAVCILSLDLLGLWEKDAATLRHAVGERTGISPDNVMVACTHSHSGPDTWQSLCWNDEKLEKDRELLRPFWDMLPGRVAEAAGIAKANAHEVKAEIGFAQNHEIAHNRRLRLKDGSTCMNWELPPANMVEKELGPIDSRVTYIGFRNAAGKLAAALIHYPCHAAILAGANNLLSGDYPGMAAATLEEENNCLFVPLNGAAGNVNHIDYTRPERTRDENEVRRCAESYVVSVGEAMIAAKTMNSSELACIVDELPLNFREIPEEEIRRAREILERYDGRDLSMPDGVPPELNARKTLKLLEVRQTDRYDGAFARVENGKVIAPLQVMKIGNAVIATGPGEFFVEFGLRFAAEAKATCPLFVSLANGHIGYLPTPDAFNEGGYEPGLGPNYLAPESGDLLIDKLLSMAKSF